MVSIWDRYKRWIDSLIFWLEAMSPRSSIPFRYRFDELVLNDRKEIDNVCGVPEYIYRSRKEVK